MGVRNGSINNEIRGVYGCVTVVCLRHILIRCIWTTQIFLYPSETPHSKVIYSIQVGRPSKCQVPYECFGNDLLFLAWWVCCSLPYPRDFETFGLPFSSHVHSFGRLSPSSLFFSRYVNRHFCLFGRLFPSSLGNFWFYLGFTHSFGLLDKVSLDEMRHKDFE